MKVWVIEDELPASRRLVKMLESDGETVVEKVLESVGDTVTAIRTDPPPDLMVMDIHLADGSSFEIFRQVNVDVPVIFTTAYDQYALEAFKVNSIDYLLKPVKQEELMAALVKYKKLHRKQAGNLKMDELLKAFGNTGREYKKRFAVKYGEHLKTIDISNVAYFFTENKVTFLVTKEGTRNIIDYNMDDLESVLDPANFFRINRQFIISVASIAEMHTWTKARVLITLNPATKLDTIVSSERAAAFKQWLDGA